MKPFRISALALLSILFLISCEEKPVVHAVAGVPQDLAADGDFDLIFSNLADAGIRVFFPTFQYEEVPVPKSFGHEVDFVPPCSKDDPAFVALSGHEIKLIVPAEILYPDPASLPEIKDDPLVALIECVGREGIYGVTNYDEAVANGIEIGAVEALYQRVKTVDPSLPVLMVHMPAFTDREEFANLAQRERYFEELARYSEYGDVVGFDIYPIPLELANLGYPGGHGTATSYREIFNGYLNWQSEVLPGKKKLIVMQGFAHRDLYEKSFRRSNFSQEMIDLARAPTKSELESLLSIVRRQDVDLVVWWGQGALETQYQEPWPSIVSIAREEAAREQTKNVD